MDVSNIVGTIRKFADFIESLKGDEREVFTDSFEDFLDRLLEEDAFGTEGQNDPRGDNRDD